MKTELTKNGWKETTTKYFKIRNFGVKPLALVDDWIECNERLFPKSKKRHRCDVCKTKWRDIPLLGNVNIIFLENGPNMTACDDCFCKLEDKE